MGGWEELPPDLINAIGKRLQSYVDHVRLSAVCASWNSLVPKRPIHLFKQIPWLLLPFDDETQTRRGFYSILDDKVYHLDLPETRDKWFRGSSHGWLVTVETSPALHLFNPLTKVQISLPPLDTFPKIKCYDNIGGEHSLNGYLYWKNWNKSQGLEEFIEKLVLSSPPPNDFLGIAIFGEYRRLAFCRRNDKKWTAAETCCHHFMDIIFFEDMIYALTKNGYLLISTTSSLPKFTFIPVELPKFRIRSKLYLVGSSNGLMMVERWHKRNDAYRTAGFKVYLLEFDSSAEMLKWSEIVNLGDNMMFLGYDASVLTPFVDFPKLKGNCIYYADDKTKNLHDYGGLNIYFFDLDDALIKEFGRLSPGRQLVWPPVIWLMPNPLAPVMPMLGRERLPPFWLKLRMKLRMFPRLKHCCYFIVLLLLFFEFHHDR